MARGVAATPTWAEAACLATLHFLGGAIWAVQRPQGFLVVLFLNSGISEGGAGLITVGAFTAGSIGGPLLGLVADRLPLKRRHWVYSGSTVLKGALQLLAWPAVRNLQGPAALWACLLAVSAASFWDGGAVLTEATIRIVGADGFGRIRLWGGIGFASGSLLTGLLAQLAPRLRLEVAFPEGAALALLTVLATLWLAHLEAKRPNRTEVEDNCRELVATAREVEAGGPQASTPASAAGQVYRFLCSGMTPLFFATVWALGIGEGAMQMYTYVRLEELPRGTSTVMGLSAVCMIISEVPFFYYSGRLVAAFGVMPIVALALLCQALRQFWISLIWDAAWVLPGELLHGITFSVANAAVCTYVHEVAPADLRNTAQALLYTVFNGLGQGGATLLGATVIPRSGTAALFRLSALLAAIAALLPAALALAASRRTRQTAAAATADMAAGAAPDELVK